ncbi:ligand-dependent nuclear receptor-interacting factor 1-like isoform X2 [Pristis pectinata]|uniref:ligand-dependent nuclear receptor-interacting factor 1-like isoform X2 n=1 Tax=Pristis pectinata TaxID=685728 RepID=UPI00223D68C4|nr:ligand-dependent nuclear receptor-interacting factor 1-like isoform X2 [Pristis pectinata]
MNNVHPLLLQNTDGSGNSQCTSGCLYRIVQTTGLDGKNLLKLIPLSNNTIHYIPAVPLSISTGSTSTKISMIPVATTDCSGQTCLPILQHTNTGRFLITSVEAPTSNSKVPPANSSQEKIPAAPTVAPLQCPGLTAVTLSGLPIQTKAAATSAVDKGSRSLKTATVQSSAVQKTQPPPTLPLEQQIYKVALSNLALQNTQPPPTLAQDQMAYKVTTVSVHGTPVQKTQASSTLPKDAQSQKPTTVPSPGVSVQKPQASPASTVDHKTYMFLKSPILPSGHHLQIPANAEVKSVPASLLPLAIQQKILATAAANLAGLSQSSKSPPTVIYVCPVNTVKTIQKRLPSIRPKNIVEVPTVVISGDSPVPSSAPPARSAAVSNSEQSTPQDTSLNSAMQNKQQFSPRCLIPVKSSNNLASKILKNLADQQHAKGELISLIPPTSVSQKETNVDLFPTLKENALVMYNGKVYLVIQKNNESSSPGPETDFLKVKHIEKESTLSSDLPQTKLQIKIKEEPEDPDFEPVHQQEKQLESWPTEKCDVQNPSNMYRAQGRPIKSELMEPACGTVGEETDEQLLKKAGIHSDLRICLTRISPKLLEQWEKSKSPAISESVESSAPQTKKADDLSTDAISRETQVNLMLPVKKEEPIDAGYYAYHTKEIKIKLEPQSPVKRKPESVDYSVPVKKQCLERVISNWESEHAYSCLSVNSTETPTPNTDEPSHINSHSEQEALASITEPSSVPEEHLIMESSPTVMFNTGTNNARCLHMAPSIVPAPSISSLSIGHSSATEISTAQPYTPPLPLSVDETTRDEKIRRLKEILKEKEAALEAIRKKMIEAKPSTNRKRKQEKKQRIKRAVINRESEHAYSCLPGENAGGTACSERTLTGSLTTRSGPNVTESSNAVSPRSAAANKVLDISAVSEGHLPTIPPPSSVDKTTRDEKIRRLKEILKEKEAALETIRKNKVSASSPV